MGTEGLAGVVAVSKDKRSGIVVETTLGSLRFDFLVGRGMNQKGTKMLSLKPESPVEFVTLVEEDRGYLSAPSLTLLRLPLSSSQPSL